MDMTLYRILCAKFDWNWPAGSWEEYFWVINAFQLFGYYISPWNGAWPIIWNKKPTLFPFSYEYFVLSLVKISLMVLENKLKMWKERQRIDNK